MSVLVGARAVCIGYRVALQGESSDSCLGPMGIGLGLSQRLWWALIRRSTREHLPAGQDSGGAQEMNSTKNGTSARAVVAQRFGMATMYLAAAALVSWSAMAAKRSQGVPALAAIDTVGSTIPTNAEPIVEPLVSGDEVVSGSDDSGLNRGR